MTTIRINAAGNIKTGFTLTEVNVKINLAGNHERCFIDLLCVMMNKTFLETQPVFILLPKHNITVTFTCK
jgi:hypothetical protein